MVIGIDARAAVEVPGGKGRYVRELIRHLPGLADSHRFHLYAREVWDEVALPPSFRWRLCSGGGLAWQVRAARLAARECDAYLATTSYLPPLLMRLPSVLVVQDLVVFDRRLHSERAAALIERLALKPAVHRAVAVVAVSESTRKDLVRRVPGSADKVVVIPDAAGPAFSPRGEVDEAVVARYGLRRPYVLAVGRLERRKNLARLVEAFRRLPDELRAKHELVLAGESGDYDFDGQGAGGVRYLGFVPDPDLPALFRAAELFCYPSLYEGFGLPPLEAMQCGTAVVLSNTPALIELGGDAVRYVDPYDVADIGRALAELLADPPARAELAARGQRRASRFDWTVTAQRTVAVLERSTGAVATT